MIKQTIPQIQRLTVEQKRQLMQELWREVEDPGDEQQEQASVTR